MLLLFSNSFFLKCTLAIIVGVFFPLFSALSVLFLTLFGVKCWKRIEKGRKKKKRNRALSACSQLKTTQANLSTILNAKFDQDEKLGQERCSACFLLHCFQWD